jgi:hypothetical protein
LPGSTAKPALLLEPSLFACCQLQICAFDPETPLATCSASDAAACSFSYSWDSTPNITATVPPAGKAGDELLVVGYKLDTITKVGCWHCPGVWAASLAGCGYSAQVRPLGEVMAAGS